MTSAGSSGFDNSKHQKKLAKPLLKKLNNQPNTARTPKEIYEEFLDPMPMDCSLNLVKYLLERMIQHEDAIIGYCDEDSECIQIIRRRVGDYIDTHLDTPGDPFPELDPSQILSQD